MILIRMLTRTEKQADSLNIVLHFIKRSHKFDDDSVNKYLS